MTHTLETKALAAKLLADPNVQDSYFQEIPELSALCNAVMTLWPGDEYQLLEEMAASCATLSFFQEQLWNDSIKHQSQFFGPWELCSAEHRFIGVWFWLKHHGDTGSGMTYSGVFYRPE